MDRRPSRASIGSGRPVGPVFAWGGLLLVLLARSYRAFLLTLVVVATIPVLWSWSSSVVRTGSMEPAIGVGDVVVAQPFPAGARVPVGRVMIFTNPSRSEGHTTLVHRVVEDLGDGTYATAGDANRDNDAAPVPAANFHARPTLLVPYIGLPLTWWAERDLVALAAWLVATMAALYFSSRPPCDPRHRRRNERNRAQRAAARASTVLRHAATPIIAVVAVIAAVFGSPLTEADAAFSATTTNHGSTWTASSSLVFPITLAAPADAVRGTVPLTATLSNPRGLAYSVRIEYTPAGTTTWQTICTRTAAPYTCDWATSSLTSQGFDLRAVATSTSSSYTSTIVESILVDNAAPTVTMQDPGTPLRGTVTFAATAADTHSGVAQVVIQYAVTGSSTYTDLCTIVEPPYACALNTTALAGGSYAFRAVAIDVAGNTTASTAVNNRVIDNTVSSVSVADPGAFLDGTVTLTASANSTAGVTSVRIQRASAGTTTWTDICTDTFAPYTCGWNTRTVGDALYDLRAVLLDGSGKTTTSAVVAGRSVDNRLLRAYDVQTANGHLLTGLLETGDSITFTYSEQANLTTISPGWTGSAMPVILRLRDGNLLGLGSKGDTIDILRSGSAVNLGSVNLRESYISSNQTAQFAAIMVATNTTINGVTATRVTITTGTQASGPTPSTGQINSTMLWTPSAEVTDPTGRPVATAPATESGVADREF
jgi:signal peptidase I